LDPRNHASELDDPFEATPVYPSDLSGLYRRLALCKPCLIQECLSDDPWKVLVAVTLLNKTSGKLGIPAFWNLISKWPTPLELSLAKEEEVIALIHHLGTQCVRSRRLILLSRAYLQEPPSNYDLRSSKSIKICSPSTHLRTTTAYPATPISHLPGTGRYALDSYRIFCTQQNDFNSEEWKTVLPTDKELVRYLRWKWAYCESKAWSPKEGVLGGVDVPYLATLIHELESSTLIR